MVFYVTLSGLAGFGLGGFTHETFDECGVCLGGGGGGERSETG